MFLCFFRYPFTATDVLLRSFDHKIKYAGYQIDNYTEKYLGTQI